MDLPLSQSYATLVDLCLSSKLGRSILTIVADSMLCPQRCEYYPTDIQLCLNTKLVDDFLSLKLQLHQLNAEEEFDREEFGFIISNLEELTSICTKGFQCVESNFNLLGLSRHGIYLSRHADLCIQRATQPSWDSLQPGADLQANSNEVLHLLVVKYLPGRQTTAVMRRGPPSLSILPTAGFHSHCSIIPPTAEDDPITAFERSQVYCYELENRMPKQRPRCCLPYALVGLAKSEGHFNTWLGIKEASISDDGSSIEQPMEIIADGMEMLRRYSLSDDDLVSPSLDDQKLRERLCSDQCLFLLLKSNIRKRTLASCSSPSESSEPPSKRPAYGATNLINNYVRIPPYVQTPITAFMRNLSPALLPQNSTTGIYLIKPYHPRIPPSYCALQTGPGLPCYYLLQPSNQPISLMTAVHPSAAVKHISPMQMSAPAGYINIGGLAYPTALGSFLSPSMGTPPVMAGAANTNGFRSYFVSPVQVMTPQTNQQQLNTQMVGLPEQMYTSLPQATNLLNVEPAQQRNA